jgi:hypothetical protein
MPCRVASDGDGEIVERLLIALFAGIVTLGFLLVLLWSRHSRSIPFVELPVLTLAFFIFIAIPCAHWLPDISVSGQGYYIWGVPVWYGSLLVGAVIGRWAGLAMGPAGHVAAVDMSNHRRVQAALNSVVIVLTLLLLLQPVLQTGSLGRIWQQWTSGDALHGYLDNYSANLQSSAAGEHAAADTGEAILNIAFLIAWGDLHKRRRRAAAWLWAARVVLALSGYLGRSSLLMLVLLPFVAEYLDGHVATRKLSKVLVLTIAASLIIMVGGQSLRMGFGLRPGLGSTAAIGKTFEADVRPFAYGMDVRESTLRGPADEYVWALLTAGVPRAVWRTKPWVATNAELTQILTGSSIGRGTAILTFTVAGEAWYYFGDWGPVVLFFMFGFIAVMTSTFLAKCGSIFGMLRSYVLFTMAFLMRSTFMDLWMVSLLIIVVTLGYLLLFGSNREGHFPLPRLGAAHVG